MSERSEPKTPTPSRFREYAATMLVGLVGAGSAAFAVSRPWVTATATQPGIPALNSSVTGADLHPPAGALSLVLLAAFGAVLATRGRARQGIGLILLAAAAVVLVAALVPGTADPLLRAGLASKGWTGSSPYSVSWQLWRLITGAGSVLCLAAGWLVVRRGRTWPSMGARYDAPAPADTTGGASATSPEHKETDLASETAIWQALDEGRDPTQDPRQQQVTMGPAKRERDPHS